MFQDILGSHQIVGWTKVEGLEDEAKMLQRLEFTSEAVEKKLKKLQVLQLNYELWDLPR